MKTFALATAFGMAISATASANNFSVVGPGGALADNIGGVWQTTLPAVSFSSAVAVANPVTSITSVTITGISHTWIGDLHIVLSDPTGVGHNLMVRPGFLNTTNFGNSGDFLGGTYVFVDPGTLGALTMPTSTAPVVNPPAGTYQQSFGVGAGLWAGGSMINNASLSTVTGPAGNWSLLVYDWAAGDIGTIMSWQLDGTDNVTPSNPFCAGDGLDPNVTTPCPCGNFGTAGNGCANSVNTAGANLTATGTPNPDTITLMGSGMPATVACIYLQGDGLEDAVFGDGVRCAGGTLRRLKSKINSGGASQLPNPPDGDPSVSSLGLVVPGSGAVRYYQTYYRNSAAFCTAATFNVTNGWKIVW